MEYEFELRFKLPKEAADPTEVIESLGRAECTDALVGIGLPGRVALRFTREAGSANEAVLSALRDVKSAIPAAKLIEVGPDLVGLTEVAEILGMTRQNMRKLMLANSAGFPAPVHEGSAVIWHLEPVLQWLKSKGYGIEERQIDVAQVAMQINLVKESDRIGACAQPEIQMLVA
jgi:predicted DNA-binding transcriptional regulator AlpA